MRIAVVVTDGRRPVADAAVHLAVATANGNELVRDGVTDRAGQVRFQWAGVNPERNGVGVYTAEVTVSKSGFSVGSSSATFEVIERAAPRILNRERLGADD